MSLSLLLIHLFCAPSMDVVEVSQKLRILQLDHGRYCIVKQRKPGARRCVRR